MVTTLKKQHVWRADKTIQPADMRLKLETNFSVFEQPKHRIKMSAQCSLRTVGPMCCFCSPEELYHSPGTVRQAGDSLEGRIEPWTPGVHVRLRATHPLCYPVSIIASSYIAGYPYLLHFPHPPPQPSQLFVSVYSVSLFQNANRTAGRLSAKQRRWVHVCVLPF